MFRCRRDAGALNVRSIAPDVRSERSGDALKRHDTAMHRLGLREMDVKSPLVRLDFTKTFPHRHIRWFGVALVHVHSAERKQRIRMKRLMAFLSTVFAVLALIAAPVGAVTAPAATSSNVQIEPRAGTWHTWVLASGSELRPPAPPDQAATTRELAELHTLQSQRDTAGLDLVSYWDAGAPAYR